MQAYGRRLIIEYACFFPTLSQICQFANLFALTKHFFHHKILHLKLYAIKPAEGIVNSFFLLILNISSFVQSKIDSMAW